MKSCVCTVYIPTALYRVVSRCKMVKCDSVANVASSRVRKRKGRELRPFELVEIRGVEPLTFSMPLRRSTN